jgi:hypothetical protein
MLEKITASASATSLGGMAVLVYQLFLPITDRLEGIDCEIQAASFRNSAFVLKLLAESEGNVAAMYQARGEAANGVLSVGDSFRMNEKRRREADFLQQAKDFESSAIVVCQ